MKTGWEKHVAMLNFIKICQPSWLLIVYQDHFDAFADSELSFSQRLDEDADALGIN